LANHSLALGRSHLRSQGDENWKDSQAIEGDKERDEGQKDLERDDLLNHVVEPTHGNRIPNEPGAGKFKHLHGRGEVKTEYTEVQIVPEEAFNSSFYRPRLTHGRAYAVVQ
jgi:hypothetical protein